MPDRPDTNAHVSSDSSADAVADRPDAVTYGNGNGICQRKVPTAGVSANANAEFADAISDDDVAGVTDTISDNAVAEVTDAVTAPRQRRLRRHRRRLQRRHHQRHRRRHHGRTVGIF
jgi:hypothetical protein